jgi:hypothetical protein
MKIIIILLILSINLVSCKKKEIMEFTIILWDNDYSMATSMKYEFDKNKILVTMISNLVNENDSVVFSKEINSEELETLTKMLNALPLDSLKNEYINQLVLDGNQKKLEISFNNYVKKIRIKNYYNHDIGNLFVGLNTLLPKEIKIYYKEE